jgi:hypothetical protein
MSLKDVFKGATHPAVLVGVGLVVAAPVLLRASRGNGRKILKRLVHKSMDIADSVSQTAAESHERWRDLLAEIQAERNTGSVTENEAATSDVESPLVL